MELITIEIIMNVLRKNSGPSWKKLVMMALIANEIIINVLNTQEKQWTILKELSNDALIANEIIINVLNTQEKQWTILKELSNDDTNSLMK